MANEIAVRISATVSKGSLRINFGEVFTATMAGDDGGDSTQIIGTTAEAIDYGEVSGNPKILLIKNADTTNFLLVGFTNPPTEMKLLPGEILPIVGPQAQVYAKADTAAVRIRKALCEL